MGMSVGDLSGLNHAQSCQAIPSRRTDAPGIMVRTINKIGTELEPGPSHNEGLKVAWNFRLVLC